MKNLHFCTKDLIRKIKYDGNMKYMIIRTYRASFIPSYRAGEIINLNERKDGKDTLIKQGKVIAVIPIQYRDIGLNGKKEILNSYKDHKFHPDQWFFEIVIKKWSVGHYKTYQDTGFLDKYAKQPSQEDYMEVDDIER